MTAMVKEEETQPAELLAPSAAMATPVPNSSGLEKTDEEIWGAEDGGNTDGPLFELNGIPEDACEILADAQPHSQPFYDQGSESGDTQSHCDAENSKDADHVAESSQPEPTPPTTDDPGQKNDGETTSAIQPEEGTQSPKTTPASAKESTMNCQPPVGNSHTGKGGVKRSLKPVDDFYHTSSVPPPVLSPSAIYNRLWRVFQKAKDGKFKVDERWVQMWQDVGDGRHQLESMFEKVGYSADRVHKCFLLSIPFC